MSDELSSPLTGVRRLTYLLWPVIMIFVWNRPWADENRWVGNSWTVVAVTYLLLFTVGAPFVNRRMRRQTHERAGWTIDGGTAGRRGVVHFPRTRRGDVTT